MVRKCLLTLCAVLSTVKVPVFLDLSNFKYTLWAACYHYPVSSYFVFNGNAEAGSLAQWKGPCLGWYSQLYMEKGGRKGRKESGGETGRQKLFNTLILEGHHSLLSDKGYRGQEFGVDSASFTSSKTTEIQAWFEGLQNDSSIFLSIKRHPLGDSLKLLTTPGNMQLLSRASHWRVCVQLGPKTQPDSEQWALTLVNSQFHSEWKRIWGRNTGFASYWA